MLKAETSTLVDKFIEELEDTLELCDKSKLLPPTSFDSNESFPRFTETTQEIEKPQESSPPPSVYKFKDQEIKALRWVPTGVPEKKRRKKGRGWTPSEHQLFEEAYIQIEKETMKPPKPRAIFDVISPHIPELTVLRTASHLQKYLDKKNNR